MSEIDIPKSEIDKKETSPVTSMVAVMTEELVTSAASTGVIAFLCSPG